MQDNELRLAYLFWRNGFIGKDADDLIAGFLRLQRTQWIRLARKALFLRSETVAKKLGITRSRLEFLERTEKTGNIQLRTLQEVAAAMDCELVYAIRPQSRQPFSHEIWPQIYPDLLNHHWLKKCDPRRKPGALALLAKDAMLSPKYRRAKGWCRKA